MTDETEDEAGTPVKAGTTTVLGIDPGAEALLSVCLGWLSGAIFLIVERDNDYVRFHAFQAVVTFLGLTGVGVASSMVPFVGWMIALATAPVAVILWFVLMIKAWEGGKTGERFKLPIIGDIVEANLGSIPKI